MAGGIDDYGTHHPLWAAVLHRTTGPIFEMGMGHHSTPTAHMIGGGRTIISADTDAQWIKSFEEFKSPNHELHLVQKGPGENKDFQWRNGWLSFLDELFKRVPHFGCALVDGFPGEIRIDVAKALKGRCDIQVWHDVEGLDVNGNDGGNYQWETIIGSFQYSYVWKKYRPWTAVVSDTVDFKP